MLVFTPTITSRLKYIFGLTLGDILGIDFRFTTDPAEFSGETGPKINYSERHFPRSVRIKPSGLLFEEGIREQDLYAPMWRNMGVLYMTDPQSDLPFDPFAASFYMVSRYEEYLEPELDVYGRFDAYQSIAYRNRFHRQPVVDLWVMELEKQLVSRFPGIKIRQRKFTFVPTIDVDEAYAFRHKGIARTIGGFLNAGKRGIKGERMYRLRVLIGRRKDPYDTYDLLHQWHKEYSFDPVFFFHVGKKGKYDKNLSLRNRAYRKLVKKISCLYEVGIHPSYRSNEIQGELEEEIATLQKVTGKPVVRSRQHYLKLSIPFTYRTLVRLGIREDYTMGFASESGFRAGIATPFPFYDLEKEEETSLKVFPFQVMDGTLNNYLRLDPTEVNERLARLIHEVRSVNGTFISLWHNSSLGEWANWKGWSSVYETMLKTASGKR